VYEEEISNISTISLLNKILDSEQIFIVEKDLLNEKSWESLV
jgi:hypothetical protein